jgi:hypothetical protein
MVSYRLTVRRRERDICYVHCLTLAGIREALRELRYAYPKCFFILKRVEDHL